MTTPSLFGPHHPLARGEERMPVLRASADPTMMRLAADIVARANRILNLAGVPAAKRLDVISATMDLIVCMNHNPDRIDLRRLNDALTDDLCHDLGLLIRHIDRRSGELAAPVRFRHMRGA